MTLIGGNRVDMPHSPWHSDNTAAATQSAAIFGRMDGPYDFGFGLGLFDEPRFYQYQPAANSVTATEQLSDEELLEAHPGAWITTNALADGASSVEDARSNRNTYSEVIKSVSEDRKTIIVYGWSLPMGPEGVPSLTHLETYYFKGYTAPTVFVGAPTKMFGANVYMSYDDDKAGANGKPASSLIHQLEWEEIDMNVNKDARPNSVSMLGLTITPLGNAAALTRDSYDMLLAGAAPTMLKILDGCGSMAVDSSSLNLPARCNLNLPAATSEKTKNIEVFDFEGRVQAHNNPNLSHAIDLQYWLEPGNFDNLDEANKGATFLSVIPHLGVMVDASLANPSDQSHAGQSGSNFADLQWSQGGHIGGLSICGFGTNCGFSIDCYGFIDITSRLTISKKIRVENDLIKGLDDSGGETALLQPTSSGDWHLGTRVDGGANITGVNHVFAAGYVETLTTPASSSAECSVGEFTDDANFHYVCVSANKWRRVALSDF